MSAFRENPTCAHSEGGDRLTGHQCRCLPHPPPPQHPPPPLWHAAGALVLLLPDEAKTENFFESFVDPQCGHLLPFQRLDRTRISLSFSH